MKKYKAEEKTEPLSFDTKVAKKKVITVNLEKGRGAYLRAALIKGGGGTFSQIVT